MPSGWTRRGCLASGLAAVVAGRGSGAFAAGEPFRSFLAAHERGGRVEDDFQNLVHSEAQGYAMLLATAHGDEAVFERLWAWTAGRLRRDDGLFSWAWRDGRVTDRNNATDGDLLIAWALLRAADRFAAPGYRREALRTLAAVRRLVVVHHGEWPMLLPGEYGFAVGNDWRVNPSYFVFPALDRFRRETGDAVWGRLVASGLDLVERSSANAYGVAPDWWLWPVGRLPDDFTTSGYDALRVPLYLAWSGRTHPVLAAHRRLWLELRTPSIDLVSGATADYPPGIEHAAVGLLCERALTGAGERALLPEPGRRTGYYASVVTLLADLAWRERFA